VGSAPKDKSSPSVGETLIKKIPLKSLSDSLAK